MRFALLACVAALLSSTSEAQMYRVVGPDGRVTYTDQAPQGKGTSVKEVNIPSYPEPQRWQAPTPTSEAASTSSSKGEAPASPSNELVMYSTQSCDYCKQARSYMRARSIAYREVDVGKDKAGAAEFARLGGKGVPLFSLGRQTLAGFSADSFDAFLRSSSR
jgi:glutaredoxin